MIRFGEKFVSNSFVMIRKSDIKRVSISHNSVVVVDSKNEEHWFNHDITDFSHSVSGISVCDKGGDQLAYFAQLTSKELFQCFMQWLDPLWDGCRFNITKEGYELVEHLMGKGDLHGGTPVANPGNSESKKAVDTLKELVPSGKEEPETARSVLTRSGAAHPEQVVDTTTGIPTKQGVTQTTATTS